jgi:glycolate oxidase FAD binding subunit
MAKTEVRIETPAAPSEAAEALRTLSADKTPLRMRGGGTKFTWGAECEPGAIISTKALAEIKEHNAPDMTAILGAGTPLAAAQKAFAQSEQMLALDPPLVGDAATIGGIIATNDSGPLRHRYRAARDLVLGMTVALSDGTLARSGSRVIKNVAGYDIAKLFAGSLGTLGLIVEVIVRLHPLPKRTVTVVGRSSDPAAIQTGSFDLGHAPLEIEALDVGWADGSGQVLARFGGVAPEGQSTGARALLAKAGLDVTETDEDADLWARQRDAQRAVEGELSVKLSALPGDFEEVVGATQRLGGSLVGRAGLGLYWLRAPSTTRLDEVRRELGATARYSVLLDAPEDVRAAGDAWGEPDPGALRLMNAVKSRFDPAGVCAPGLFVGGI